MWISVEEGRTAGGLNSVNRTPQEGGGRPEAGRQGGGGMVGGDDGGRRGGGGSGQGSHGAKEDPHSVSRSLDDDIGLPVVLLNYEFLEGPVAVLIGKVEPS